MKLRFKKPTFSRKVKSVEDKMYDTTFCTIICEIELTNLDVRMDNMLPDKHKSQRADFNKVFENFTFKESNYDGLIYRAVSIGRAIKSIIDTDNPKVAEKLAEARARLQCYKYAEAVCNARFHYLKELAYGNLIVTTNCPECTSNGGMYDQWLYYRSLVDREEYYINKLLSEL